MFTTLALLADSDRLFGGFPWFFVLIPLFWIAVFVALVAIFGRRWRKHAWNNGYGHPGHWGGYGQAARSAEASLAERFAQGDIDEKEYRARLEVLRANAYPQPKD